MKIFFLSILIIQGFVFITGYEKTKLSIDCTFASLTGKTTEILCKATGGNYSDINWWSPHHVNRATCPRSGYSRECEVHDRTNFYKSQIDVRNGYYVASILIIYFDIKKDAGVWYCNDYVDGAEASCNKTEGPAITSIECPTSLVHRGQRVQLVCHIQGLMLNGIWWMDPLLFKVASALHLDHYDYVYEGYEAYIDSRSRHRLIIKSLIPKIHGGKWLCYDGLLGNRASCNITIAYELTTNSSDEYAEQGREYNLTCYLEYIPRGFLDVVSFYRKSSSGAFVSVKQAFNKCSPVKETVKSGYEMICGEYTSNSLIPWKIYKLKITNPSIRDQTDWWCDLEKHKGQAHHNVFALKFHGMSKVAKQKPKLGMNKETVSKAGAFPRPFGISALMVLGMIVVVF